MRDELDKYFLNKVIKTAKPKISFSWNGIVDEIISTYNVPFDGGESIEAHIYAFRRHGVDFRKQLEVLLSGGYLMPSDKDDNKYILTKKGLAARKFDTVEDYENTMLPKTLVSTNIDYDKFDKEVISYLRKQPQKFGDISDIVNKYVSGVQDNIQKIHRQLIYLIDRDIIEIRDLPEDPMQMQDDWWGNFPAYNANRGDKVQDLKAKLSAGYLKLSLWDRKPITTKILDWGIPAIVGFLLGLITCNSIKPKSSQAQTQFLDQTGKVSDQKKYDATNYDSLRRRMDTDSGKATKPKDGNSLITPHVDKTRKPKTQ